ncbi:hypothetical protein [Kitasatospora sp. NPDC092286]|uniref:hypothetical protein n=1 Tax=Kitasatospora sp. NPDC092286 TaxID=3364087 RepID=UPI003828AAB2
MEDSDLIPAIGRIKRLRNALDAAVRAQDGHVTRADTAREAGAEGLSTASFAADRPARNSRARSGPNASAAASSASS